MSQILNDALYLALTRYLTARESGQSYQEPLADALIAMDKQSPSTISEAGLGDLVDCLSVALGTQALAAQGTVVDSVGLVETQRPRAKRRSYAT